MKNYTQFVGMQLQGKAYDCTDWMLRFKWVIGYQGQESKKNMKTRKLNSMYKLQGLLLNNAYPFNYRDYKEELDLS
jgi:hypothetical protein